jgi:hypothetical protein
MNKYISERTLCFFTHRISHGVHLLQMRRPFSVFQDKLSEEVQSLEQGNILSSISLYVRHSSKHVGFALLHNSFLTQ